MRKMLLVACAALFTCTLNLQAQDTTKTLIHFKRPQYLGIYIAPEFQYGQLGGDFTSFNGGSFMLLLNKKWAVGITGMGNSVQNYSPSNVTPQYLRSGFGGLKLEYTPRPNSAVHVSFPLVIGAAYASQDTNARWVGGGRGRDDNRNWERNNNVSQFVVVQPSMQIEANLFRFAKIFGGINYRLMFDAQTTNTVTKANAQGFSANVGLKLGLFDWFVGKKEKVENQPITN
jgi:hypothetical protein